MNRYNLESDGLAFLDWSRKNPIGKIPTGVAKEGAGENRIPFAHLANSVPVYLTLANLLKQSHRNTAKVLDLGCGTGRNISFVKDYVSKVNFEFFGIDYSASCIEYAKKQYKKYGVRYVQHDGKVLPFKNNFFDYIVSSHVLEHVPQSDTKIYFSEISRILKRGGIAVIGTPNRKYCQDLFCINQTDNKKFRLILPHLHEYYYKELKNILVNGKWFEKYSVDQTVNLINRKLMINSINKVKPGNGLFNNIKFELYSLLRKNSRVQDLMAKLGTEFVLKNMKTSYEELLEGTKYLVEDGRDIGDNFIIIAVK